MGRKIRKSQFLAATKPQNFGKKLLTIPLPPRSKMAPRQLHERPASVSLVQAARHVEDNQNSRRASSLANSLYKRAVDLCERLCLSPEKTSRVRSANRNSATAVCYAIYAVFLPPPPVGRRSPVRRVNPAVDHRVRAINLRDVFPMDVDVDSTRKRGPPSDVSDLPDLSDQGTPPPHRRPSSPQKKILCVL